MNKEEKPVPEVDINAPLKAPLEKSTEYEPGVTPKNKLLYILGIISFLGISLLAVSILVFYLTAFKGKAEEKKVAVVEQAVQEEQEAFDRGKITFEVLNGSGVTGAAKEAGDSIERLGYQVIKEGNAEAAQGNQLYLRKDIEGLSEKIIADLEDFAISTVAGELREGSASARIILGK